MPLLDDWNETKNDDELKEFNATADRAWYEIPKRNVNFYHGFNFKLVDPKTDGLIFLANILFIPYLISLIAYLVFPDMSSQAQSMLVYGVMVVSAIVGFFVMMQRIRGVFWKKGIAYIYLFVMIPAAAIFVASLVISFFIKGISDDNVKIYNTFISMIAQMIAEIIILYFFFFKDQDGWGTIKLTIKQNWRMLLLVTLIGLIAIFVISNVIFGMLYNDWIRDDGTSKNQAALTDLLNNKNHGIKYSYAILLFVTTIIIAPLCEEVCTRYSFFANSGNKWIALVTCALYFGFIHCVQTGDFAHLPTYITAGLVLSAVFITARGNFTYSWMVHLSSNLLSYILIFAAPGM